MTIEGEVVVCLDWNGGRVERADVRSTRPVAAARLFEGKSPDVVRASVPRLFSICGRAQGAAASRALACASGEGDADDETADVMLEAVNEHFWRLLMDVPAILGNEADAPTVAAARQSRDMERLARLAGDKIYGMPPAAWLALPDIAALGEWARSTATIPARLVDTLWRDEPGLGQSDVALMPEPTRVAIERAIVAELSHQPAFSRAPTWNGSAVETGPLARMRSQPLVAALLARDGNTVATRVVARLAEVATLVDDPPAGTRWVDGFAIADGDGVAAVQTARGLLLHRARVAGGRVVEYQIVAPTEWNFHPEGALARGLSGLSAADAASLERKARLAVQALDPCVAFRIEISRA